MLRCRKTYQEKVDRTDIEVGAEKHFPFGRFPQLPRKQNCLFEKMYTKVAPEMPNSITGYST